MVLISKCCVGVKCRYNGKGYFKKVVERLGMKDDLLAVCPEILGGLLVPRVGCSIKKGKAIGRDIMRTDYTKEYKLGAQKTLELCLANNITKAYLLKNSPSCGAGYGITAKLLAEHGIKVIKI